jgi:hypothetical protein
MVYFNLSGNIPEFRIALQIYVRGDIMYGALNFSFRVEISSYPPVFLDFDDLIILSTSRVETYCQLILGNGKWKLFIG